MKVRKLLNSNVYTPRLLKSDTKISFNDSPLKIN